jgi:hypothetical protein
MMLSNPLQSLGDASLYTPVVDPTPFLRRSIMGMPGTEGARAYGGGARTGSPAWVQAYEAQHGLRPGTVQPVEREADVRSFDTGSRMKPGDPAKYNQAFADQIAKADAAARPLTGETDHLGEAEFQAQADAKAGTDLRMPLAQKQAAEVETLRSAGAQNDAQVKQWGSWAQQNGIDPAKAVSVVTDIRQYAIDNKLAMPSDNKIKFALSLLRQKGQL